VNLLVAALASSRQNYRSLKAGQFRRAAPDPPLIAAIKKQDVGLVRSLIHAGAKIDARDQYGHQTPHHCSRGKPETPNS